VAEVAKYVQQMVQQWGPEFSVRCLKGRSEYEGVGDRVRSISGSDSLAATYRGILLSAP